MTNNEALGRHVPEFSLERPSHCPFDPAPAVRPASANEFMRRMRLWDGSTPWVITGFAAQRALLANRALSVDPRIPGFPYSNPSERNTAATDPALWRFLTRMDAPDHPVRRRMLADEFTPKRIEALRPRVQRIVAEQLDQLLSSPSPADYVTRFALPIPSLVICELLGVPYADRQIFHRGAQTIISFNVTVEARTAAVSEVRDYLKQLVAAKLRAPDDDLLSRLAVDYVKDGTLTADDVATDGFLLLTAGHETTTNMIALGTLLLLSRPDQVKQLRSDGDPKAIRRTVEELLRYLAVTHTGRRRVATADIEIGGNLIRAGEGVIMPDNVANRDPEAFSSPDELDVTREPKPHLTFGFGPHACLGQGLARLELQIVFATLFDRVPGLRLAIPFEEVDFKNDMRIYGVHSMPVAW
jgi:cytochrome P450